MIIRPIGILLGGLLTCLAACAPAVAPLPPDGAAVAAAGAPPAPSAPATAGPTGAAASPPAATGERAFGSDPIPSGAFLFYEDFERGYDRWSMPDGAADVAFRPLNAPTCGGLWSIVLGTADHARFVPAAGEHVLALTAPIDLTGAKRPFFKYDVKGVTFPAEAVALTAELQGRDGAWTPIGRQVRGGYVFMASIGADISAWAGQKVALRFRAVTAAGVDGSKGIYLDDIQVIEPAPAG